MKGIVLLICLLIVSPTVFGASIMPVKCDGSAATDTFKEGDELCVYGTGFAPEQDVDLYIVEDQDAYEIGKSYGDVSTTIETTKTSSGGVLRLTKIWDWIVTGIYDLIADVNQDGKHSADDVVNSVHGGIIATASQDLNETVSNPENDVPEFSTVSALMVLIITGVIISSKRKKQ